MWISPAPSEEGARVSQAHYMRLAQAQFGCIFQRHHAFLNADVSRQGVQHGRLARAGTAGDHDVELRLGGQFEHAGHAGVHCAALRQVANREAAFAKPPNGYGGAVNGQRRPDDVDARAVL